jgi:hypothetical protein
MIYTKETIKIFNDNMMELICSMIINNEEFSIVVSSKNWSNPLPERLLQQDHFIIQIKDQTLEDSYIDSEGHIVINTKFDTEENSLLLYPEDVKGILDITMQNPIMIKPFEEKAKNLVADKLKSNPSAIKKFTDEELEIYSKSINVFAINNPNYFGNLGDKI